MNRNYNVQFFGKEDVKKGLHLEFINSLLMFASKSECGYYNDIHVTTDGETIEVEWCQRFYDCDDEGKFQFVDSDEIVMIEREMPDNTYRYFLDEEDYNNQLNEFLKEHPSYYKTQFGRWANKDLEIDYRDLVDKENK